MQVRTQIMVLQARISGNFGLVADLIATGQEVKPENMTGLVRTAAAVAQDVSGALTDEARQAMLVRFETARAVADEALHDGLDRIVTVLRQTTCDGLCAAVGN